MIPAVLCGAAVLLPLGYLARRALEVDMALVAERILPWSTLRELLGNTLLLTAGVLVITCLLALPAAWLTTHTDLPGRRMLTWAAVLPLAIPAYLMAYTLLSLSGDYGVANRALGVRVPPLRGLSGSLIALSLYNYPYMFLNLRVALRELDPALIETARSLGHRPGRILFSVYLPHLKPALLAGALLIALHVIADFGVVSLLRYRTFSYEIYSRYTSAYSPTEAAWPALVLVVLAGALLLVEAGMLRGLRLDPTARGVVRRRRPVTLGLWALPAYVYIVLLMLASVVIPVATILFWALRSEFGRLAGDLGSALSASVRASLPAAVLATLLAAPIAYMALRYRSKLSFVLERLAFVGYATPALAFGLGIAFFTLRFEVGGEAILYQSLTVMILAYSLHFLAEAVGPIRSSLYQATPRLEEAARSLGAGPFETFRRVTFPLLRNGLAVSTALVFLSCMKELPLTFMLRPTGFDTLAFNVWDKTNDAAYADAAPYAFSILLISASFVGILLLQGRARS